jgi:hypothetical protein
LLFFSEMDTTQTGATKEDKKVIDDFVKNLDRQPYHEAIAEVQAAISSSDNPPQVSSKDIDKVLTKYKMGPTNGPGN